MGETRARPVHQPPDPDPDSGTDGGTDGADPRATVRQDPPWRDQLPVVAVVALGGALGACARYGATLLWPTAPGTFPTTTFAVNAVGCALIGVFMVVITDMWAAHRLVRPFFGTGVLGGFTTFSTYAVDIRQLLAGGHTATALAYLFGTAATAVGAVWAAATLTRRVITWRQR